MTSKSIEIKRFPLLGEKVGQCSANLCSNLRRVEPEGSLCLARPLGRCPDQSVIAEVNHHAAGLIKLRISANGTRVVAMMSTSENEKFVGTLSGRFLSALEINDSLIAISTSYGIEMVTIDETGLCKMGAQGHRLPMLRFESYSDMQLAVSVEEKALKSQCDVRSTSLAEVDAEVLTADLLKAYSRLSFSAGVSGYSLQPFLARYRYEDADGRLLFVSAPIVVGPQNGFQCMEQMSTAIADGGSQRGAFALRGNVFRTRLATVPNYNSGAWPEVRRLVVEATAPIHPVNFAGEAANMISREGVSGVRLHFFLPGASVTMSRADLLTAERMKSVLNHADSLFREVAVVNDPFRLSSKISVEVTPASYTKSAERQIAEIDSAIEKSVVRLPRIRVLASIPHRFSAATADVAGETVVWGNISVHRFNGYPIEHFAVAVTDDDSIPWSASVVAVTADGERRLAAISSGIGNAPRLLSPMISYPAPDIASMKIRLKVGEDNYGAEFQLTPSADGRYSYYVSPSSAPIVLSRIDEDIAIPTPEDIPESFASSLITAPTRSPMSVSDSARVSNGSIILVKTADRRGGAWEFSLRRIFIFSSECTLMANLSRSGEFASIHPFDSRVVDSAKSVVATTIDRYPLVAMASGDLIGLTRGTLTTFTELPYYVTERCDECAPMFWDSENLELHLADPCDNDLMIVVPFGYKASQKVVEYGPVDVKYSMTLELPRKKCSMIPYRPTAVSIAIEAADADIIVEVTCGSVALSRVRIRGKIFGPLAMRVPGIPTTELTISIIGAASTIRLRSAKIQLSD